LLREKYSDTGTAQVIEIEKERDLHRLMQVPLYLVAGLVRRRRRTKDLRVVSPCVRLRNDSTDNVLQDAIFKMPKQGIENRAALS
jgi:hypothetical protein